MMTLAKTLGLVATWLMAGLGAAAQAQDAAWSERAIAKHTDFDAAARATHDDAAAAALIARGKELFAAKFTEADGRGRPKATQGIIPTKRKRGETAGFQRTGGPDASACSSCHNEPFAGGAGDFVANVFVSEGFESADFDSLDPSFSSERNTNALFGDGLVELLAREMTADLQGLRAGAVREAAAGGKDVDVKLVSKGVSFGWLTIKASGIAGFSRLEGIDNDLVVRPFSQKGVFTSLRQFTINAMNQHFGMQASERYGVRWTGTHDFDEDGVADELSPGDVSAVTAWQATLPPPTVRRDLPADWKAAAETGSRAFDGLGCAACHKQTLPLKSLSFTDPGSYDAAGTLRTGEIAKGIVIDLAKQPWAARLAKNDKGEWLVPLFADLKRHVIVDEAVSALGNELMAQRFVERDVFRTAPLWGVASTAPYGHRGDFSTLDGVIRAHGGEAREARDAYIHADEATRQGVIALLKTLVIEDK